MTGFKLRIFEAGSNRSTKWATNTALQIPVCTNFKPSSSFVVLLLGNHYKQVQLKAYTSNRPKDSFII